MITAAALYEAFREAPDVEPMVLPDAVVVGSTAADLADLCADLAASPWEVRGDERSDSLAVFAAPDVRVDVWVSWGAPIEFDFDLREIEDDAALEALLALLRYVASSVGKDVEVRGEGAVGGPPVLTVRADSGAAELRPLSMPSAELRNPGCGV